MSGLKTFGHLHRDGEGLAGREPPAPPDACGKRLAGEQFHGEEGQCRHGGIRAYVQSGLEDPADVGMSHLTRQLDFLVKMADDCVGAGQVGAQGLERDGLVQQPILGFVYLSHSSPAEHARDKVPPGDQLARKQGKRSFGGCGRLPLFQTADGEGSGRATPFASEVEPLREFQPPWRWHDGALSLVL